MARSGQVIDNPVTGERIIFRRTAADTDGEYLEMDLIVPEATSVAVEHVHRSQSETIEVLSGSFAVTVGGSAWRVLGAGERVEIPADTAHAWRNDGPGAARVRGTLRPALEAEEFFETFYALNRAGRTNAQGVPSLLQMSLTGPRYDVWLARPPRWVQRALFALLAPAARLLGYRPEFHEPVAALAET
jgi:quercetin dioxygenase-like cupin family protein